MATIVIDAGHGGSDWGATNNGRMEKADALAFAIALGRELTRRGYNVVYTRQTDIFIPLAERARISNNARADLFVSIHRNSFTNAVANGFENIVRPNASAKEIACATSVLNQVNSLGVFANRGLKTGNFVVLTQTQAPAMLVEYGFISNANDNTAFDNNFNRLVQATANGIDSCLGTGGVAPPQPPPITPPAGSGLTGTVTTASGNLNVRSAPNTGASVIGTIPSGTRVNILAEQNGWYQIRFGQGTGWVSGAFVNNITGTGRVATTGGNLNMRAQPSANAQIIGSIPNNTQLQITGFENGFYRVNFNGQTGWVSASFVNV